MFRVLYLLWKRLIVNVTNVHHRNKATTFLYETYDLKRWTRQEIHVQCHRVFLQTFDVLCENTRSLYEHGFHILNCKILFLTQNLLIMFHSWVNRTTSSVLQEYSTIHNVLFFVTWVHRFTSHFTYPFRSSYSADGYFL